jgi:PAS domain S-box-containing protein
MSTRGNLKLLAPRAFAIAVAFNGLLAFGADSEGPEASSKTPLWRIEDFIVQAAKTDPEHRVRVRGVVTTFLGADMFFIQDASGGILVWQADVAGKVRLHQIVDVIGSARSSGAMPHMLCAGLRVVEEGKTPIPVDLDPRVAPAADTEARLVRIRARVAPSNASQPEGMQVLVDAFGSATPVIFDGPGITSRWPELNPGDLVTATGVLSHRRASWRIIVPSRKSLVRLESGPSWTTRHFWSVIAVAGSLLAGGWILAGNLRRKPQPARIPADVPLPDSPPLPASSPDLVDAAMPATPTRALPPVADAEPEPSASEAEMARRYQELFESATDVILTHDLAGVITSFNPAGERLLGWDASEVIGHPIYSLMAPAEAEIVGGLVSSARSSDTPTSISSSFRLELKGRDGRIVPFEVNSWIEYHAGAPVGVQAICRNISHRLRSEDERLRFERRLQETQKLESLGILAGGIAHDFNNLLTAVLGNASLARLELGPDSIAEKSLHEIEMAAERASDLCNQMLAYSGQGRFVVTRVDLSALVFETLELLQASVSKRAKLELHLADKLPGVHGDTSQLRQVLMNIVTNASEALGDGPGTITVRTSRIQAEPGWLVDAQLVPEIFEGEYIMLEITDSGSGMEPEVAARMFEPFFTTKFTGRGLGLAAVLGIARSHRAALKVETRLGQGTTFQIALPATGVFHLGEPGGENADTRPLLQATVLAVDDEASVRRTVTRALEMLGCKVVAAENGAVALQRMRQFGRPFDLVLLDLTMPQMDGVETLRELRRIRPELPVVLMSGFAQAQAMARFGEHRLAGFLQKPFKLDDLSRLVGQVLTEQQGLFPNLR